MTLEQIEAWCTYAGKALLIATPFVLAFQIAAQKWLEYTKTTRTPYDDRVARVAVDVSDFLAELVLVLPRVAVNLEALRNLVGKIRRLPRPPRAPAALLLALVLLPTSMAMTGCSTFATQTVRSTLLEVDGYVDGVNERVGTATDAAQVRAEAAAEAAPAGTEREVYDEIMRPWERVGDAITSVQVSLLSVATTMIAVDAGRGGDVFGTIACAVRALSELAGLLPVVGIEVPAKTRTAIDWLKALAGESCASPPEPDPEPDPPPSAPASSPEVTS